MSIYKVEDVSRPGGDTLSKHRGVKVIIDFAILRCCSCSPQNFGIQSNCLFLHRSPKGRT